MSFFLASLKNQSEPSAFSFSTSTFSLRKSTFPSMLLKMLPKKSLLNIEGWLPGGEVEEVVVVLREADEDEEVALDALEDLVEADFVGTGPAVVSDGVVEGVGVEVTKGSVPKGSAGAGFLGCVAG